MKKYIEVDVAFEEATELIKLTQDATKKGIELEVVNESADYNGGWPVVKFIGDGQDLLEFLDARGFEFLPEDLIEITS